VTAVTGVLFDNASFFGQRTGSEAGRPRKAGNCLWGIIGLAIRWWRGMLVRRWMPRWRRLGMWLLLRARRERPRRRRAAERG
jgi:hypothetical protein